LFKTTFPVEKDSRRALSHRTFFCLRRVLANNDLCISDNFENILQHANSARKKLLPPLFPNPIVHPADMEGDFHGIQEGAMGHLSVGKRIAGGFAVVLALLAVVAVRSYVVATDASEGFAAYRDLTLGANAASDFDSELLHTRLVVKDFLVSGAETDKVKFEEEAGEFLEALERAREQNPSPERAAMIDTVARVFADFRAHFNEAGEYTRTVERLLAQVIEPEGTAMERALFSLMRGGRNDDDLDMTYAASNALRRLLSARGNVFRHLDTGSSSASDMAEGDLAMLESALDSIDGMLADRGRSGEIDAVRQSLSHFAEAFREASQAIVRRNALVEDLLDPAGDEIAAVAQGLVESVQQEQDALGSTLEGELGRGAVIVAVVSVAAAVVGVLFAVLITAGIVRPLTRTAKAAEDVAQGRTDIDLEPKGKDEIAAMQRALINMVEQLQTRMAEAKKAEAEARAQSEEATRAMREAGEARTRAEAAQARTVEAAGLLEEVSERVASASEEISAQAEQGAAGAARQSERVAETATAMEQMNATVLEVAKSASSAAETSGKARAEAEGGASVVRSAVQAIQEVETHTGRLKTNMDALASQAQDIGRIIGVIDDIADQTNLLALNAAIEAARAGDAGRGFAVVADEVRKLAEKTMEATKEVGQAIRAIQDVSRQNTEGMDDAAGAVDKATGLADESGRSLARIVELVASAADEVHSIAAASEEQSAASEQITRGIEEINQIAGETSQGMGQTAQAIGELNAQIAELREMVGKLKSE